MANIRIEKKDNNFLPWILGLLLLVVGVYIVAEVLDEADEEILTEAELNDVNDRGNRITDEEYDPYEGNEGNFLADRVEKDLSSYSPVTRGVIVTYDNRDMDVSDAYGLAVNRFMNYTDEMNGEMGLDHEFSHRALTLLANAAEFIAISEQAEDKAKQVKSLADDITKDPYATNHANHIRMAALLITEILENAANDNFEEELTELRSEAQAINRETLTLEQKEDVRSFFAAARRVLSAMSRS